MTGDERELATRTLRDLGSGEAGAEALMPLVYERLRAMAARWFRERPAGATLQPTALVHEAYLHLVDQTAVDAMARAHFCAVAATAMRQILIQRARRRGALKRGGAWKRVELDGLQVGDGAADGTGLLELHEALETLAELHERQARVVELRFFGGLTTEETAAVLGVSTRTVEGDWRAARAWLHGALADDGPDGSG